MVVALAKNEVWKRFDLSSLRKMVVVGAPVAPELSRSVSEKYNCIVGQGKNCFYYSGIMV